MKKPPDEAHQQTDKELAKLERRIAKVYLEAAKDLEETIRTYFEAFAERDAAMKKLVGTVVNGKEWTEQDYRLWRLAQMARGKRYQSMREQVARRITKANEVAIAYVNDATPGVYSLNRNYSAYSIEQVAGDVGFTIWDEATVKKLIKEQPDIMPYYPPERAIRRGIDLKYGKQQITKNVTSGILQGKSIRKIANDLQKQITDMSRTSAIRAARTAITGAQNGGRMDSYKAAEDMGIEMQKEWMATLDGRTRHSHRRLDGERVGVDEEFSNGCRYPGDPQGKPGEVYNCRCTTVARIKRKSPAGQKRRLTYSEWEKQKARAKESAEDSRDKLISIANRSKIRTHGGFSAFPKGSQILENAEKVKPLPGYMDVSLHGTSQAVAFGTEECNMSPRLLAEIIRRDKDWKNKKIRLLSCNTGLQIGDKYCVAEELANSLGVEVIAPNKTLFIDRDGNISVGVFDEGKMVEFIPNQRRRVK